MIYEKHPSVQSKGQCRGRRAGELAIEETLEHMFPRDEVIEVKKGRVPIVFCWLKQHGSVRWQDTFESKNTKTFASDWVPKLKEDAISEGVNICFGYNAWPA